jgi:hypothetical protein
MPLGDSITTSSEPSDGNVFIVMYASVKNVGKEKVSTWDMKPFEVTAVYDDEYEYSDYRIVGDDEIEPLSKKNLAFCIEVPKEIKKAKESLVLNFEMDTNDYVYTVR